MDITLIQDGNSTVEHNIPQHALLRGRAQPLVADPGRLQSDPGRHLWRPRRRSLLVAGDAGLEHPLLTRHTPPNELAGAGARGDRAAPTSSSTSTAPARRVRLSERGVPVAIGGHGQQPGLAEHWEMWCLRPRRRDADRGAALRHRRSGAALRLHRSRHARARQARRPRHPRRRPDPRTSATPTISPW